MWKRRRFKPKQVFQSKKIILLAIFILILIFVVSFIRAKIFIIKDKEASPAAQNPEGFFIVDEEGVVFAKDDIGGIPNIYLYDPGVALGKRLNGIYSNLLVILGKVKTFGINVREGWITDSSFVIKEGDGTPRIIFALEDEIDIQIASLQLILDKAKIDSSKLEFIDLRFDKPIIRFVEKSPK